MAISAITSMTDVNRDAAVALVAEVEQMQKAGTATARRLQNAAAMDDADTPDAIVYGLSCIAGLEFKKDPDRADSALRLIAETTDPTSATAKRLVAAGADGKALHLAVKGYRQLRDLYGNCKKTLDQLDWAIECAHDVLGGVQ